ncbi:hypothetical protein HZB03_04415 [Candidatus Woesearchaeota archaeon]|nr:hypothetical protein [Candidatus Woesearchaeota archaeon]
MELITTIVALCVVLVGTVIVYKIVAGILSFLFRLLLFAGIFLLLLWALKTFV